MEQSQILFEGKHLRLLRQQGWEYIERTQATGVVAIIAVTDDHKIVLVKQQRVPFRQFVIELPAGLCGDAGQAEDILTAARRELLEETGYEAGAMEIAGTGAPSAGLTNERVTFVLATNLCKVSAGGGVDGEQIAVLEIPVQTIQSWLAHQAEQSNVLDLKIYAGMFFLKGWQQ